MPDGSLEAARDAKCARSEPGSPRMSILSRKPLVLRQMGVPRSNERDSWSHELKHGSSRGKASMYGRQWLPSSPHSSSNRKLNLSLWLSSACLRRRSGSSAKTLSRASRHLPGLSARRYTDGGIRKTSSFAERSSTHVKTEIRSESKASSVPSPGPPDSRDVALRSRSTTEGEEMAAPCRSMAHDRRFLTLSVPPTRSDSLYPIGSAFSSIGAFFILQALFLLHCLGGPLI